MKETIAANGPEGTVSKKTQVLLNLLEQGMRRLHDNIATINKDFLNDVELCALLTTVVENLYAVSHFKQETFTVLQYSKIFWHYYKGVFKENNKMRAGGGGGASILPTISRTTPFRRPVWSLPISTLCNRCCQKKSFLTLKLL